MPFYVGVDWGSSEHAACIVDERGQVRTSQAVPHTRAGLAALVSELATLGPAAEVHVAIERPSGLLVDTLVEAGHPVCPIHPNVLAASRDRYRAAHSKSDAADAYILADVLRTDGHRLARLRPRSDEIKSLRGLVRTRDDLVSTRVMTTNRLSALLQEFWPGPLVLFHKLESPISLAFLKRFPSSNAAKGLSPRRMKSFLEANRYTGRKTPEELVEALRSRPAGHAAAGQEQANACQVNALVAVLEALTNQIQVLTKRIEDLVEQLPVGRIVMSFPRAGKVNAAKIVAEIGDDVTRYQTDAHLAAEAGVVPVTKQSGKYRNVTFRHACNRSLRQALTCFADVSRHGSEWAAQTYSRARGRGCDHPHAIRILARAWARILWRCLRDGKLYAPASHKGAQPFLGEAKT